MVAEEEVAEEEEVAQKIVFATISNWLHNLLTQDGEIQNWFVFSLGIPCTLCHHSCATPEPSCQFVSQSSQILYLFVFHGSRRTLNMLP